jgi:hypothetical protein
MLKEGRKDMAVRKEGDDMVFDLSRGGGSFFGMEYANERTPKLTYYPIGSSYLYLLDLTCPPRGLSPIS